MNQMVAVGRIHKYPGQVRTAAGSGKEYLTLTIADKIKTYAGTEYTEYIKVTSGDRDIRELEPRLTVGTLIMVTGTGGVDLPKEKEGVKPFITMKIYGKIAILQEAPRSSPIHDDDVPSRSTKSDNDGDDNVPY